MAQSRTRRVWSTKMSRQGHQYTDSTFDITYWSNRENGQIVKRESPLEMLTSRYLNISADPFGGNAPIQGVFGYPQRDFSPSASLAYAKAYRKMKKTLAQPTSEVLLNIVEGRKSLEMIAARAFQLRGIVSNLRKGRLGDAWNYMTLNPDQSLLGLKSGRRRDSRFVSGKEREESKDSARRRRQLIKDVGALVLEIRYGMVPLMQDIQGACEVLNKLDFKPVQIRETGTSHRTEASKSSGGSPSVSGNLDIFERVTLKALVKMGDPHLLLANQLGFVNLASVAWELVPFSFLFDWALPIGPWLQGFTDFVGLQVSEGSITGTITYTGPVIGSVWPAGANGIIGQGYCKRVTRQVGLATIPPPPLTWGRGLTPGRALNAVALLVSTMVNPRGKVREG